MEKKKAIQVGRINLKRGGLQVGSGVAQGFNARGAELLKLRQSFRDALEVLTPDAWLAVHAVMPRAEFPMLAPYVDHSNHREALRAELALVISHSLGMAANEYRDQVLDLMRFERAPQLHRLLAYKAPEDEHWEEFWRLVDTARARYGY